MTAVDKHFVQNKTCLPLALRQKKEMQRSARKGENCALLWTGHGNVWNEGVRMTYLDKLGICTLWELDSKGRNVGRDWAHYLQEAEKTKWAGFFGKG